MNFFQNLHFFYFSGPIVPHTIVTLPNSNGMQLLLCYDNEGVYVNTYGKVSKNIVLQWGELPTSVAYIGTGQIMGWGNKAIEIRSVESGHLDGVFMHKKAQKLKFLCERNDKVFFSSAKGGSSCQIYFMTLNKPGMANWWSGRGNLTNFFMSGHTPLWYFDDLQAQDFGEVWWGR